MRGTLENKKILVTGGTGFIGGRVVEKLMLDFGARVRVLVRNYARALDIARYPVDLFYGDINQLADVTKAAEGCDIIIHCAYGNAGDEKTRRQANVLGTRNALDAALQSRVAKFVHVSTVQVYGALPDGDFDETRPRRYYGDPYSDSKLDAEELVFEYFRKHGLPATAIQPTVVYGPNCLVWTVGHLYTFKRERYILVDNGSGFCNAVYVDDVADAIILAAARKEAVGESFLVSAEEPTTWRDFYGSYERMLRLSATVAMSAAEADTYDVKHRQRKPSILTQALPIIREQPLLRERLRGTRELDFLTGVASSLIPAGMRESIRRKMKGGNGSGSVGNGARETRPIHRLGFPLDAQYYKTKARVRIDKAKRLLGYEPAFDLPSGMARTEQWARWANLLPVETKTEPA